jgi:hypothetical protein
MAIAAGSDDSSLDTGASRHRISWSSTCICRRICGWMWMWVFMVDRLRVRMSQAGLGGVRPQEHGKAARRLYKAQRREHGIQRGCMENSRV